MYYLGSKPTLGHYSGIEPLDGDMSKIEVADKTPDVGFSPHRAPTCQGRPILTDHIPTKVEWQESGPVSDVETVRGVLVVPKRFCEIVNQLEPNIHQFPPVDFLDPKGAFLAKRYFFIVCNRLDSVDRKNTTLILADGRLWMPASDIARRWPEKIPNGFDVKAKPKLVFSNAQIGNKHAWCDKFLLHGPYLSDALGSALEVENFTGISLKQGEAV